eukprot:411281_1
MSDLYYIKRDTDLRHQMEREIKQFEIDRSLQLKELQRRETDLKQQIEMKRQMKLKEQRQKEKQYIVVYSTGAMCRKKKDLSSERIGILASDTVVTVELIDGRRCLISNPMYGWVSLHTANGREVIKKINSENDINNIDTDFNATQQLLRATQMKQQRLLRKKFDFPLCDICSTQCVHGIGQVAQGKFIHWNCFGCSICDEYIRKGDKFDISNDGTFICSECGYNGQKSVTNASVTSKNPSQMHSTISKSISPHVANSQTTIIKENKQDDEYEYYYEEDTKPPPVAPSVSKP